VCLFYAFKLKGISLCSGYKDTFGILLSYRENKDAISSFSVPYFIARKAQGLVLYRQVF